MKTPPGNIIGSQLSGQDNGTFMFNDPDTPSRCEDCGWWLDQQATNSNYIAKKGKRDIGYTYDGQIIVSSMFRAFCLSQGYDGIEFRPFLWYPEHFHFVVEHQVAFDAETVGTRFEKRCASCGQWESIVGTYPCTLKQSEALSDGFHRTDLMFASNNEKHPLVLVGLETRDKLKAAGLRGLEFSPVVGATP